MLVLPKALTFIVPGKPKGQPRPQRNFKQYYTDKEAKAYRALIQTYAKMAMRRQNWRTLKAVVPVEIKIKAYFQIPHSWSARKKAEARFRGWVHPGKPDCDNIEKAVFDALTDLVWTDDRQVAANHTVKLWSEQDALQVTVQEITSGWRFQTG